MSAARQNVLRSSVKESLPTMREVLLAEDNWDGAKLGPFALEGLPPDIRRRLNTGRDVTPYRALTIYAGLGDEAPYDSGHSYNFSPAFAVTAYPGDEDGPGRLVEVQFPSFALSGELVKRFLREEGLRNTLLQPTGVIISHLDSNGDYITPNGEKGVVPPTQLLTENLTLYPRQATGFAGAAIVAACVAYEQMLTT